MTQWEVFAARTGAIEKKYLPQVHKAILKAYNAFIADLKQHGIGQARFNLSQMALNEDIVPVLKSIYTKAGVLGAAMTYQELRKGQKAANIGRNEGWINAVLNYLKINLLNFAARISETTREDILKIVERGVNEGLGAEAIARGIAESDFPLMRARVIVRTEVTAGANVGHQIGAQSFPYEVNKKWSSSRDHRVRHSHVNINGTVVEEHETFKVAIYKGNALIGYDQMQAPGDKNAHVSNRVNCRCRVVFEPKKDAQGKLIPRRHQPVMVNDMRRMTLV